MSKVKHIVLLKFKDGTTEEQIDGFFNELLDLSDSALGLEDYVSGNNCSLENLNQGFTHGFVMTFTDSATRDAYLASEAQIRYKAMSAPLVEATLSFDFEI
jgi:hypothetical protein